MTFDEEIDCRKRTLKIARWREILSFRRRPTRLQRSIILQDFATNGCAIALLATAWFMA
ncbi:MAG TPA: hypothetical protein VI358_17965 [Pseudolabrys sp.]